MKMFKIVTSMVLFSILLLSTSFANPVPPVSDVPVVGGTMKISYGNDHFPGYGGGDFNLSTAGHTYTAFCLEKFEYFRINTNYTIASVGGYAQNDPAWGAKNGSVDIGGEFKDFISNETRYLMSEYIFNYDSLFATFGGNSNNKEFSSSVQEAIWFFENETTSNTDQLASFIRSMDLSVITDAMSHVIAVNPINEYGYHQQSILIATGDPVPEPATMLLLGAGIAGLAAYRRKSNK